MIIVDKKIYKGKVIELSIDNYVEWKTNILYLLCIKNFESYITSEKIKKLRKRNIINNISDYIQDKFDDSLVYDKSTTEEDIKNDITTQQNIIPNLEDAKKSFTKSPEQRRLDLKEEINNMKFNIDEDIHIFLAILQNHIEELENIEGDLPNNTKAGILNRCLPENLKWINVFQVERFNGILVSSSKVLLSDVKLSRQFWEDAVANSNYIYNSEVVLICHYTLSEYSDMDLMGDGYPLMSSLYFLFISVIYTFGIEDFAISTLTKSKTNYQNYQLLTNAKYNPKVPHLKKTQVKEDFTTENQPNQSTIAEYAMYEIILQQISGSTKLTNLMDTENTTNIITVNTNSPLIKINSDFYKRRVKGKNNKSFSSNRNELNSSNYEQQYDPMDVDLMRIRKGSKYNQHYIAPKRNNYEKTKNFKNNSYSSDPTPSATLNRIMKIDDSMDSKQILEIIEKTDFLLKIKNNILKFHINPVSNRDEFKSNHHGSWKVSASRSMDIQDL
ncbi:hypothetical protein PIROE2DRAFT_2241 [Piromyces sp. E2]|nr:hypothetical protein PIROE2DRAFT_2241 [Piromyces sp. E2]|eukprot:OUM69811.1 hypothetical protein PIROE2DRAFT_2241 [Piromyces sp. E2]